LQNIPRPERPTISHPTGASCIASDEMVRSSGGDSSSRKIVSARGNITVNNAETAIRAALDGLGIVYMLDALAEPFLRSGRLERVLAGWSPSIEGVYLYYHGRRQPSAALRAFIDMIRAPKGTSGRRPLKNPF
jgi:DNA-binding transcriptional LysR family regulator